MQVKAFCRCGVCGKEGEPTLYYGSGAYAAQMNQYAAPAWGLPQGWSDVLDVALCGDCASRVRGMVRDMAQPPASGEGKEKWGEGRPTQIRLIPAVPGMSAPRAAGPKEDSGEG